MADLEREGAAEKAWWSCEIGPIDRAYLPWGADRPMREAVQRAYLEVTGKNAEWCASGWGRPIGDATEAGVTARVEARYRALIAEHRIAISLGFPARCVCGWEADYEQAEIDDDCGWAQWVGHISARSALAALTEKGEEATDV